MVFRERFVWRARSGKALCRRAGRAQVKDRQHGRREEQRRRRRMDAFASGLKHLLALHCANLSHCSIHYGELWPRENFPDNEKSTGCPVARSNLFEFERKENANHFVIFQFQSTGERKSLQFALATTGGRKSSGAGAAGAKLKEIQEMI